MGKFKTWVRIVFWGALFCVVALKMFFALNPFMVVILLAIWCPLEKNIDKVSGTSKKVEE